MGFGGILGSSGAKKGVKALKEAIAFNKQVFGETKENVTPFIDVGHRALGTLTGTASAADRLPSFRDQEFFQFREGELNRAIRRGLSLRGNLFSGAGLEAETRGNIQLSGEETANERNLLLQLSQLGQNAALGLGGIGTGTAQTNANLAGNLAQMQTTRGQLLGQGIDSFIGGAAGLGFSAMSLGQSGALTSSIANLNNAQAASLANPVLGPPKPF